MSRDEIGLRWEVTRWYAFNIREHFEFMSFHKRKKLLAHFMNDVVTKPHNIRAVSRLMADRFAATQKKRNVAVATSP